MRSPRRGLHRPVLPDFINPPAFFLLFRFAGVEDHAVAGFERSLEGDQHAVAADGADLAQVNAPFLAKTRMDQLLVVNASEPAGVQAAGERHFHFVLRAGGENRGFGFRGS